jgi:hypothetical protein
MFLNLYLTLRSPVMRLMILLTGVLAALLLASVVAKGADVDNGPPPAAVASLPPAVIDHGPAGADAPRRPPPVVIPAADVSHRVTRSLTRAPHGHTHTCPRGHTWDHAENPTHTCQAVLPNGQRCGLQQYTQDATPRAVTVGDWPRRRGPWSSPRRSRPPTR